MFALWSEATIALSTPLSSSCLTRTFFVGLLFSFFMMYIIRIFLGESRVWRKKVYLFYVDKSGENLWITFLKKDGKIS